jgi:hypothetical protein
MKYIATIGIALTLTGCAGNKSLYEWGTYQPALINYYKNGDGAAFEEKLNAALDKGQRSKRVPPGVHAELGYLLYNRGDYANAVTHFFAEKSLFPESASLMDKLIAGSEAGIKRGDGK